MRVSGFRYCVFLLVIGSAVCLNGCGWRQSAVVRSPRHNLLLRLRQPRVFPQSALEIEVESNGSIIYRWKAPGRELFISFIQDYCSDDDSTCGLYATGTNTVKFAFDVRLRVPVSFDLIADGVAAQIAHTYGVDHNQLDWANSADGSVAFSKRCHPRDACLKF